MTGLVMGKTGMTANCPGEGEYLVHTCGYIACFLHYMYSPGGWPIYLLFSSLCLVFKPSCLVSWPVMSRT